MIIKVVILTLLISFSTPLFAKNQLVLWHSWVENKALWQKIQQEFNTSHENIELSIQVFDHEEMKQKIIKSGFQRNTADILIMPSDWLGYHNVMQFSAIPQSMLNGDVSDEIIGHTKFEGQIRGIPLFQGNHLLFMYNKSLVKKPASTWYELVEDNQLLQNKNVKTLAVNYSEMFWFVPFMTLFNGFPVEQDKIMLNTEATVDALKYYKQLSLKKVIDEQCTYQCVSTDFYQGKFAYSMLGAWAYKSAKLALGDNLGLAPFPTMKGNEFKPMRGNLILTFPKNALSSFKNKSLLEFSRFIQQEKYQHLMFEEMGLFPVNANVMAEIKVHLDEDYQLSLAQFQQSRSLPASTSISAVWNGMYKGFALYMDDEISAEEAAAYMQKSVEREQATLNKKLN